MLGELQHIVQQVGEAASLEAALTTIVQGVEQLLKVDQCSIFLWDSTTERLVLTASAGLDARAIGNVELALGEGLVGHVAQRRRPVVVERASEHPKFKAFPLTGESRYSAFLGVPIVHLRNVVGVLVVQAIGERHFNNEEEAVLVTISAQLAGVVHGASIGQQLGLRRFRQTRIDGVPGAPGIAIGTAVLPSRFSDLSQVADRADSDPKAEELRFRQSVMHATAELVEAYERMKEVVPQATLDLFSAYERLTNDEMFIGKTIERIHAGQWAPAALRDTVTELASNFEQMSDPLLRSRSEDVRAVGRRILLRLNSEARESTEYPDRCILVGNEVSVARISQVPREKLAGIICFEGSTLSHTAILAKSLGIPAVMGIGRIPPESVADGLVIVDGYQGKVIANPIAAVLREYHRLAQEDLDLARLLQKEVSEPAQTLAGKPISILANIAMLSDIELAAKSPVEGVGLYRTEFPFMIRESFPGEDEQVAIYRQVLTAFHPRTVVMRTLDVGGDKPLPYFPLDDQNPALGWRGIRVSLNHPEIFVTQLRAMLRANLDLGNLHILLPMVSTVAEIGEIKPLIELTATELRTEGLDVSVPPLGVMIEVPSLIFQARELANYVDFYSIGTNDLTQYLMAADRGNPRVADLYDHFQPAVLRAIQYVIKQLPQGNRKLTVCGEFSSDPGGVLLLLCMGIEALSVSTAAYSKVKFVIRNFDEVATRGLLEEALQQHDANDVRKLTSQVLEDMRLGRLARTGVSATTSQ